jgi:hypothetical protein
MLGAKIRVKRLEKLAFWSEKQKVGVREGMVF